MLKRDTENIIPSLLRKFPVVTITGPRQSGKTTVARAIFPNKPYASLEDPEIRLEAREDPRSFLERFPEGGIIDEVQRCPGILSHLRSAVDNDRRPGLFILIGSQHFDLIPAIHQALAGRTAWVELLPFSIHELAQTEKKPKPIDRTLHIGGYPPLSGRPAAVRPWFGAYVTAFLERDVRQVLKVQELDTFQHFLRLCAGRTGQLLNFSSLAVDCGITHNTAKAWLSVLESGYITFKLRPHPGNFKKRLVKASKLYFYDTGLVSWLLGIKTPEQMETHPLRGNIFETFVVSELMKSYLNRGCRPSLFFWRDSNGLEVDILIEQGGRIAPVEIKSGKTVTKKFFTGLEKWTALAGDSAEDPTLIYGGAENYRHNRINIVGWKAGLENWGCS